MDQIVYERPREKLQYRGVTSLTNVELLQVIIGSGGLNMPVAKVARQVNKIISRPSAQITIPELLTIGGIGVANALRIMAAIELGARVKAYKNSWQMLDASSLALARRTTIMYATINGAGEQVTVTNVHQTAANSSMVLARRICAKVLADNAWGVAVAIGSKSAQLQPGVFELSLMSDIKDLSGRLQIKFLSFEYVSGRGATLLYRGSF